MLSKMFNENTPAHDEMMGLVAARTYRADEIITVYTGDDIGAAEGVLDAHQGYHRIAALERGDTLNKGRHVMEVLKYINDEDAIKGSGPRRMWRRLIDGYNGFTCAQYINAAYRAPKGFYDKARLCEGGTIRVRKGCVIYEGEEILFMYGKAYWDRWGGDNELKSPQERRETRGAGGDDEADAEQRTKRRRCGRGRSDEADGAQRTAREEGGVASGTDVGGMGTEGGGEGGWHGGQGGGVLVRERVVRRENGERVEEWSERRRRKRKMETPVGVAPEAQVVSRKMPKGGKVVQWTAVAWDAYVQRQRRYERGEGGGVT